MRKVVFLAVVVLAVFVINHDCFGQGQSVLGERTVRRLPPAGQDSEVDRFRCGDYFVFGPPGPRIGFIMEREKSDPEEVIFNGVFLPENVEVAIDNSLTAPKAKIMSSGGQLIKVLVRISQSEYEKSPCLPAVKPPYKRNPTAPKGLKILSAYQ